MGLFEHFPYTNFHELNLGWIIDEMKHLEDRMDGLPEEIQAAIEPVIIQWIQDYLSDAGISVDNGVLKLLATEPSMIMGTVSKVQVGNEQYFFTDPNMVSTVADLGDQVDQNVADIADINSRMPVGAIKNYAEPKFYVKKSGDDNLDGRTIAKAFATLDRAFQEFAKYDALWIYIEELGNYPVHNYGVFASKSLHLTAEADGVVVTFYDPDPNVGGMPIYASHWNLRSRDYVTVPMKIQCFELDGVTPSYLYFDTTLLSCTNVEFSDIIRFYGGDGNFSNCKLYRVYMQNTNWILRDGTVFTHQDQTENMVYAANSTIQITGLVTTAETYANGTLSDNVACWYLYHTDLFSGSVLLQTHTYNYYRAVTLIGGSRLTISTTRYNQTGNHSVAGIAASDPDEGYVLESGSAVNTYA